MSRLALTPRYPEVEHLLNGEFETWTVGTQPDGWQVSGGGNGTLSRDTSEVYSGAASMKIDKTLSGAIYVFQNPQQALIPGMYYRVQLVKRPSQISAGGTPQGRLVNVTRSQCLNTVGAWIAGTTSPWTAGTTTSWKSESVWMQIPSSFSDADIYEYRCGLFGAVVTFGYLDRARLIGPFVRPVHLTALSALTYAAVANKEILAVLTSPAGDEFDITRRIKLDGIGRITEGAEEEILQLTHGDMTLTLDDRDNLLKGLLTGAGPSDRWELVILEETGRARGLKWDRLFAGVLDLPWSVQLNPTERELTLQIFSYTKAMEMVTAEGVSRAVTDRTASITAASKSMTVSDTTDLLRGDIIALRSGTSLERFTVDRVDTGTTLRVVTAAQATFTSADLDLETPFHRDKTPVVLAGLVCDEAAVAGRTILLDSELASFPVGQPLNAQGLGFATHPSSLVPQASKLVATFLAADETKRKETTGPTVAWTGGATSNVPQGDWRPYLTSEPGTIKESTLGGNFDDGSMAWDHTGSHVYHNQHQNTGGPAFLNSVHLLRDGVDLGAWGGGVADPDDVELMGFDYDPVNARVWGSVKNTVGTRLFRYYNGSFNTFDGARSGQIRCCRPINRLVLNDDTSGTLRFYDLTTFALDREITPPDGRILLWTLRAWDTRLAYILTRADGTYIAIHDSSTLALLAVYRVSSKKASGGANAAFLTVFTLTTGRNVAVGYAGEQWFVVSTRLDGVVPYADFTGLSCAAALKEIGTASLAYLSVDRYGVVSLTHRPALSSSPAIKLLTDPLERTDRLIWEFFRESCKVSGKDPAGIDFEVIQGSTGRSAKRLEVSSPLINSEGMALAVATFYAAYLGRAVAQTDVRIDEPEEPIRVLDVVEFDDRRWLVTQVQTSARDREQDLRLFEVA